MSIIDGNVSIMGTRAVAMGPTGQRVAANVRALRERRGITLAELARRLDLLGRPIVVTGLSKIEQGDRRVDADDLVALAVALDVTPNRLLLAEDASEELTPLITEVSVPAAGAWAWATGEQAIRPPWAGGDHFDDVIRRRQFGLENRPHNPPVQLPYDQLREHRDALNALADAVDATRAEGLSLREIMEFVRMNIRVGRSAPSEA